MSPTNRNINRHEGSYGSVCNTIQQFIVFSCGDHAGPFSFLLVVFSTMFSPSEFEDMANLFID
jgi:hypothetical protein